MHFRLVQKTAATWMNLNGYYGSRFKILVSFGTPHESLNIASSCGPLATARLSCCICFLWQCLNLNAALVLSYLIHYWISTLVSISLRNKLLFSVYQCTKASALFSAFFGCRVYYLQWRHTVCDHTVTASEVWSLLSALKKTSWHHSSSLYSLQCHSHPGHVVHEPLVNKSASFPAGSSWP